MTLYCQKLSAVITNVPVWCVKPDGHTDPCTWPTNIPPDGNLRIGVTDGSFNFRIDTTTGLATMERKRM